MALEGAVQDGRQKGVEFGGAFGLKALERVNFRLKRVQLGHDSMLLGQRREGKFNAAGTKATGDWVYPGGGGYSSTMTRV